MTGVAITLAVLWAAGEVLRRINARDGRAVRRAVETDRDRLACEVGLLQPRIPAQQDRRGGR